MDEKELNIQNIDDELLPTAHEALVIRRAMRRMHIPTPDVDQEWARFAETHHKAEEVSYIMDEEESNTSSSSKRAHIIGFLFGVAASVAVLLALFPMLRSHFTPQETISPNGVQIFSANDSPSEVMLAQEKGRPVAVKDGTLAFNSEKVSDASTATQKTSSKMLTLTTPRGKDYKVTLADGTRVWMNAESKLVFPKTFTGKTREVVLHGEAYFEVAKDAKQPFIVKTDYFETKVLGTSFNIRAYSERDANVVLIEGSVSLLANKKNNGIILSPNQQALLNAGKGQFNVREVDTYPYTQWRDGFFYFDDTPMIEIMQELGRWYNVNIIFEEAKYMNTHLHFVAERTLPLTEIIRYINDMGIVDVEIQKDAVIVN